MFSKGIDKNLKIRTENGNEVNYDWDVAKNSKVNKKCGNFYFIVLIEWMFLLSSNFWLFKQGKMREKILSHSDVLFEYLPIHSGDKSSWFYYYICL